MIWVPSFATSFSSRLRTANWKPHQLISQEALVGLKTTSHIRPSSFSNVVGLVELTCSSTQPQRKKSQSVRSRPIHFPWKWAFNYLRTTIAKCGGAPSCMKIKSSIFSQVLITGQTSSLSIVRYHSAFMVSQRMLGPTIRNYFSITL